MMIRSRLLFLLFLPLFTIILTPAYSDEAHFDEELVDYEEESVYIEKETWQYGFFVRGSGVHYFVPAELRDLIRPNLGFRAALGYEYNRLRFMIESGYTRIIGTNPFVLDIRLIPLTANIGYELPFSHGLGLQANLGIGFLFSNILHFDTAINMLRNRLLESSGHNLFSSARLYLTYSFYSNSMKLYFGGGFDAIIENDGIIPLPVFEAAFSVRPFGLVSAVRRNIERRLQAQIVRIHEIPVHEIIFSSIPENIFVEETAAGRMVRLLNAVYFEANSVVMIERYRPVLHELGARLRDNPNLQVLMRAYAAPLGDAEMARVLSAARGWYCMEYLAANFGIAWNRMRTEFFGAERAPEFAGANWESFRVVEFILIE